MNATKNFNLLQNFTSINENNSDPSVGTNPTDYGFPAYMAANSTRLALPYMYFSTSTAFASLGTNGAAKHPSQTWQLFGTWTRVQGAHTLKVGFDGRQYRLSTITYAESSGGFNFADNRWIGATNSTSAIAMGQDMAQFLLGLPDPGILRREHHRVLVMRTTFGLRAGRLARPEPNPDGECRSACFLTIQQVLITRSTDAPWTASLRIPRIPSDPRPLPLTRFIRRRNFPPAHSRSTAACSIPPTAGTAAPTRTPRLITGKLPARGSGLDARRNCTARP